MESSRTPTWVQGPEADPSEGAVKRFPNPPAGGIQQPEWVLWAGFLFLPEGNSGANESSNTPGPDTGPPYESTVCGHLPSRAAGAGVDTLTSLPDLTQKKQTFLWVE